MDDIIDMLSGIDKKNEIFNLWYEVTFLRMIVSHMVSKSLYLQEVMTPQVIDDCRKYAQKIVQERFPNIKIDFSLPTPKSENMQESPCCIPPNPSESLDVSLAPSNEV